MSASPTTQSRDELTAWLDSHIGQTVTAEVIVEDDDGITREVLGAEGKLWQNEGELQLAGAYTIGDSAFLTAAAARRVHVSGPDARRYGVDFAEVELTGGAKMTITARGDQVRP
jgi:hypothetical protein